MFYDPAAHRPLATRFAADIRVAILFFRSLSLWLLGYPDAAEVDLGHAIEEAREIGLASTLLPTLNNACLIHISSRNDASAKAEADELCAFADEKGAAFWKAHGTIHQGSVLALTGKDAEAVHVLTSGITAVRSTGGTLYGPSHLSYLARAHAGLGQFDDARRCAGEAITAVETTKEKWFEAEVYRIAGEIALMAPEPDAAKAEGYFDRALSVARAQQAKSWELRTATSMARLWRDQGKRDAGPRSARSGLWLVHRRLRHARSERGQGLARRVARLTTNFETAPTLLQRMSPKLAHFDVATPQERV